MSVYTGQLIERELLGNPERKGPREIEYLTYRESMRLVKDLCAEDPSDPSTRFASDLHYMISEELGLDNLELLRYYSALKTPLDIYHGVDAFFELEDENTGIVVIVTIDLTANPEKQSYKADHIIFVDEEDLDIEGDNERYLEFVRREAKEIASMLKEALEIKAGRRAPHGQN